MENILQQEDYQTDIQRCALSTIIPWKQLQGKTLLISGATGMVASTLIDMLMTRNNEYKDDIHIIAVSRNAQRAKKRFKQYLNDQRHFTYISQDITKSLNTMEKIEELKKIDYIIHAASNTHPQAYSTDPIGTIATNVDGTKNLLDLATTCGCQRFVFLSSVEIYGENRGDEDKFKEDYLGYLDCNTMRAGYPESKRLGETLCSAYEKVYGIDFVIPRLSRVYGPTLLDTDTKAISQFIHKAVSGEDIVLKSAGNQLYSYSYVTDVVLGILKVMLSGQSKCAYNISDKESDITLKELAEILAEMTGKKVLYDLPDAQEAAGYTKVTKALLDSAALEQLDWQAKVHMREGLEKTVKALRLLKKADS